MGGGVFGGLGLRAFGVWGFRGLGSSVFGFGVWGVFGFKRHLGAF